MAISFDAKSKGQNISGTTLTFSHTCTGSDRILLVSVSDGESTKTDSITGVTYAGVAMSLVSKKADGYGYLIYMYALIAPATGTNDIVVTRASSGKKEASCASYTGVDQTLSFNAQADFALSSATCTRTLTTTVADCWLVDAAMIHRGHTAGSGTLMREGSGYNTLLFDSDGSRSVGSNSLVSTQSDGAYSSYVTIALAPAVAAPTFSPTPMMHLMQMI